MKIYHFIIILIIVTAIASFFSLYLTDLKANYDYTGLGTDHMNLTIYNDYDSNSEISSFTGKVQNGSATGALDSNDLDIGLFKRFSNVWGQMSGSFHNMETMGQTTESSLHLPKFIMTAVIGLIALMFALKIGLGWLLDR